MENEHLHEHTKANFQENARREIDEKLASLIFLRSCQWRVGKGVGGPRPPNWHFFGGAKRKKGRRIDQIANFDTL